MAEGIMEGRRVAREEKGVKMGVLRGMRKENREWKMFIDGWKRS